MLCPFRCFCCRRPRKALEIALEVFLFLCRLAVEEIDSVVMASRGTLICDVCLCRHNGVVWTENRGLGLVLVLVLGPVLCLGLGRDEEEDYSNGLYDERKMVGHAILQRVDS